jgi:hypothetical protein
VQGTADLKRPEGAVAGQRNNREPRRMAGEDRRGRRRPGFTLVGRKSTGQTLGSVGERLDGALSEDFRTDARRRSRVGRPNKAKPFSFCLFFL